MNICAPDFPVSEQIVKGMFRIRTEVYVVCAVQILAAAVIPKIEGVEVLVLRVVVGIWETSKSTPGGFDFDFRAINLEVISTEAV